ncbi:MAG: transketolase [Terrimicrobiaceae bacterium]
MNNAPEESKSVIQSLKRQIVLATVAAGEGHIASAFSILDILWVLYGVLRIDPADPRNEGRDRFILSKGHGSLALYAVLAKKGFFPIAQLEHFGEFNSPLGGHPDCNKVPGVEASTGSLGHGFPMAVGMALGLRIKKSSMRIYCLIGDGEANEGSVWEAAMLANHHKLGNLTCILDYNHSGDRALCLGDLRQKFTAFGWESCEIDGHDHHQILMALNVTGGEAPRMIIANTIKGKGCQEMENNPAWHHKAPSPVELSTLLAQLT